MQEFITTRQGYRLATSTGGVLTGRGADIILIDDPLKPEEALSEAQRQAANEWYDHTLYSRLNDKRHGAIVIIMQRLHEDDLVGHVLAQEPWEVLRFPAIAEADEVHQIETIWGPQCFTPPAGRGLAPRARAARDPRPHPPDDRRIQLRRPVPAIARPVGRRPGQGGLVQALSPRTNVPERFDRIVQSWDTANKATELSDFSVCTTWGVKGKNLFLLDVFRRRLEYPALKRAVREQQSLFGANVVLIEDKASGTQLIQELIADGCHGVTALPADRRQDHAPARADRDDRERLCPHPRDGALARRIPARDDASSPRASTTTRSNSTAQFLDWFQRPMSDFGFREYYRRRYEEQQFPERYRVRVRRPPNNRSSHVQTLSGRHLSVDPDGTIELSELDAKPLIASGWVKIAERDGYDDRG